MCSRPLGMEVPLWPWVYSHLDVIIIVIMSVFLECFSV